MSGPPRTRSSFRDCNTRIPRRGGWDERLPTTRALHRLSQGRKITIGAHEAAAAEGPSRTTTPRLAGPLYRSNRPTVERKIAHFMRVAHDGAIPDVEASCGSPPTWSPEPPPSTWRAWPPSLSLTTAPAGPAHSHSTADPWPRHRLPHHQPADRPDAAQRRRPSPYPSHTEGRDHHVPVTLDRAYFSEVATEPRRANVVWGDDLGYTEALARCGTLRTQGSTAGASENSESWADPSGCWLHGRRR